jgi:hypothetical protein
MPGPSFIGLGKRPDLTPAHQHVFLTGIMGGMGGAAVGLPMICVSRRKPVSGREFILIRHRSDSTGRHNAQIASKVKKWGNQKAFGFDFTIHGINGCRLATWCSWIVGSGFFLVR